MKHLKVLPLFIILFLTTSLFAQAPEGINYQAVARDNGGAVLANDNLTVRMTVKENGPAGTTVFQETHNVSTNDFGLFDLTIGQGSVVTGTFSNLNWGSSSHFLQVEVDDGSGYVNLGTSQFVSVPYALYAKSAGGGGGSYTAGNGIDISGNVITNTGDTDASDDLTTSSSAGGDVSGTFSNMTVIGLQGRSVSSTAPANGEVLKWNGSNWAPANDVGGGAGDNWGTQVVETDATLTGNGTNGNALGIAQQGASNGEILKWNGFAWAPANDNNTNTSYSAGIGLSLSGTTFSNTGDTDASDDITSSTNATGDLKGTYPGPSVIALQGNQLNAQSPFDQDVLKWDNSTSRWVNAPSFWEAVNSLDIRTNRTRVGIGFVNFPTEALHIRTNNSIGDDILLEGQNPQLHLNTTTGGFTGIRLSDNQFRKATIIHDPNRKAMNMYMGALEKPDLVVDSLGKVGIGTYSPTTPLEVNGTATVDTIRYGSFEYLTDGGPNQTEIFGALRPALDNIFDLGSSIYRWDDVYATNGTINTSDKRDKKNITSIDYGINAVMQLKPVSFEWKENDSNQGKKIGFLAQDLLPLIPEVVKTEEVKRMEDGTTQTVKLERFGVYYSDLIPVLVKGIQEQQIQIEELKNENELLKQRMTKVERQ